MKGKALNGEQKDMSGEEKVMGTEEVASKLNGTDCWFGGVYVRFSHVPVPAQHVTPMNEEEVKD